MQTLILLVCFCFSCLHANFSWLPSSQLSNPIQEADYPGIAVDPNGNAIAVWRIFRTNPGELVIQAATKLLNQPWSTYEDISVVTEAVSEPAVKVDAQGNAVAVWVANVSGTNQLRSATKLFGQPWSAPDLIPGSVGGDILKFIMDSNGNITLVWQAGFHIYATERTLLGSWTEAPTLLSSSGAYPAVSVDPNGNVIVAWEDIQNNVNNIVVTVKPFGMGWQLPGTTVIGNGESFAPLLSINSSGDAMVIASGYVGVAAAYKPFNEPWEAAEFIMGSSTSADSRANAIIDNQGNAMAFWIDNEQLSYSIKLFGQPWTPAHTFFSSAASNRGPVSLSINSCGLVLASWAGNGIHVSSGVIGGSFSPPFMLGSRETPSSGQNSCNHAIVVCVGDGGNPTVMEAVEGFIFSGVDSFSGTQRKDDFGTLASYTNRLTWSKSLTEGISGYRLYRNGSFLADLGPQTFEYDDEQQKKNMPVEYGITAVDKNGAESSPIVIQVP